MKVIIYTAEGIETLDNIEVITKFDDVIVFASLDGTEYHSLNDFPTMYKFEVTM